MYKKVLSFMVCASVLAPFYAQAYEAGEVILRGGVVLMEPREDSDPLYLNANISGVGLVQTPLAGTKIGVDNEFTLAGTVAYMLNDSWGLELVIGAPAEFTIPVKGLESMGVKNAGTTDVIPLIVSLQHYFDLPDERVQPYVGLGINYTVLTDEAASNELEGFLAAGDQDLQFDNSFSFNLNVGVDFKLDDRWLLNASVYYVDLETDAKLKFTNSQGIGELVTTFPLPATGTIEASLEAPTWAYFLTAGYRF